MCRTEAAGGSGPVFCLTPNLVFAPVLACALLLPSCPDVFFAQRGTKDKIPSPIKLPHSGGVPTLLPYMFLAAPVNHWLILLFHILHPILQRQVGFRKNTQAAKNYTTKRKDNEKPGGKNAQIQHPTSWCFRVSHFSLYSHFAPPQSGYLGFYLKKSHIIKAIKCQKILFLYFFFFTSMHVSIYFEH